MSRLSLFHVAMSVSMALSTCFEIWRLSCRPGWRARRLLARGVLVGVGVVAVVVVAVDPVVVLIQRRECFVPAVKDCGERILNSLSVCECVCVVCVCGVVCVFGVCV